MKNLAFTFLVPVFVSLTLLQAGCSSEDELRGTTGIAGIGGGIAGGGNDDIIDDDALPDGCSDVLCAQINLRVPDSNIVINLADCETSSIGDTCVVPAPEQDLFYNNLEFIVETADAPTCEYYSFRFYRYVRSDSATYAPRTDPAGSVDCSVDLRPDLGIHFPEHKECWGGAWTESDVFPDFPAVFRNAELGQPLEILVQNSNSFGANSNPFFNRFGANDLDFASRSVSQPHYLADSMQDYVAACVDEFGEPIASIIITIDEQDSSTDNVPGW